MKFAKAFDLIAFFAIIIFIRPVAYASNEPVIFQSTTIGGKTQTLNAYIYKPEGQEKFPAIILLHGCAGVTTHHHNWAELIKEWGYVVFIVDSFNPRSINNVCDNGFKVSPSERAFDAYGAAKYVQQLPYVDENSLGIIGFSHGGWTGLRAIQKNTLKSAKMESIPIKAAVLFYPCCDAALDDNIAIPTLILIGDKDDWTPSSFCVDLKNQLPNPEILDLTVYKDATHSFDMQIDIEYLGHKLKYNPDAAEKAKEKTKDFFGKHLLGK